MHLVSRLFVIALAFFTLPVSASTLTDLDKIIQNDMTGESYFITLPVLCSPWASSKPIQSIEVSEHRRSITFNTIYNFDKNGRLIAEKNSKLVGSKKFPQPVYEYTDHSVSKKRADYTEVLYQIIAPNQYQHPTGRISNTYTINQADQTSSTLTFTGWSITTQFDENFNVIQIASINADQTEKRTEIIQRDSRGCVIDYTANIEKDSFGYVVNYEYDQHGNWITAEKIQRNSAGQLSQLIKRFERVITYFP